MTPKRLHVGILFAISFCPQEHYRTYGRMEDLNSLEAIYWQWVNDDTLWKLGYWKYLPDDVKEFFKKIEEAKRDTVKQFCEKAMNNDN